MSKYVMCKGYYGIGGSLAVLVCAMRLAKELDRELIIDWKNCAYRVEDADVFEVLFDTPKITGPERSAWNQYKVWPDYWQDLVIYTKPHSQTIPLTRVTADLFEELSEEEQKLQDIIVITRDDKYWHGAEYHEEMSALMQQVVPNKAIMDRVNGFVAENFSKGAIGVHYRHGNGEKTVIPPDISWFFQSIDEFLLASPESAIFLCTDCFAVIEVFREKYGDKVVYIEKDFPEVGAGPMYNADSDEHRLRNAIEAILDIWTLSFCNQFVGSKSFFSGVAAKLNGKIDNDNSRWWVPSNRSHNPPEGHLPIEQQPNLYQAFNANSVKTDNVYIEATDIGEKIFYQYEYIETLTDNYNEAVFKSIAEKIKKLRFY